MGDFAPFGRLFIKCGQFLKTLKRVQNATFLTGEVKVTLLMNNGLGCIWGIFFLKSSGHPA
jgi:hypothetical protein